MGKDKARIDRVVLQRGRGLMALVTSNDEVALLG
jgi:hypothetical protein